MSYINESIYAFMLLAPLVQVKFLYKTRIEAGEKMPCCIGFNQINSDSFRFRQNSWLDSLYVLQRAFRFGDNDFTSTVDLDSNSSCSLHLQSSYFSRFNPVLQDPHYLLLKANKSGIIWDGDPAPHDDYFKYSSHNKTSSNIHES